MEQVVEILEVTPEDFKQYQDQINTVGCAKLQFKQYFFDSVKVETQLAVLIKRANKVAWLPKSCLYKLEEATENEIGSVWVISSFKVDWMEDF